jgi:integrase/recombinase XerD
MHHLTQPQVKALLDAVPDPRHRTAFLVTYLHGLRISETVGLRVRDVASGYIIVPRLKGSMKTEHSLYRPESLRAHPQQSDWMDEAGQIEDIIAEHSLGAEDRLFPYHRSYLFRVLKAAGEKAGLPAHLCHPHVLKHSIAMRMVKRVGIEELKQYLGHKSLNSTGQYLRVSDAQASRAVLSALEEK